jgi:catechol 2,3-dioxygenase-like lactoylglutathione lyase family enzyme
MRCPGGDEMNLKFINPVVFVKNIQVSKAFYAETLGLNVLEDHGPFVLFENHFSIHQARELAVTIWDVIAPSDTNKPQGRQNLLLYFETTTLEEMFNRLKDQVELIHPIRRQTWGQKVFRFYDPDGHVIEIGEPL